MIKLDSVTKTFGSCTVVNNVSLSVEKGEYFALLGPNGAGKTTIVRMLLGFVRPSSGSISIKGETVNSPLSRNSVGYLAEQLKIPPNLSGREYLLRHASLKGLSRKEAAGESDRVLQLVGMKGNEKKKSKTYSKGMKQRVGLAAAMIGRPELLILDEPVSGLDPIGIREIRVILEKLRSEGMTMMLNSHLLSEVEKTCTTAGIMHKGKVLIKDSIEAIVKEGETLEDVFVKYVSAHA